MISSHVEDIIVAIKANPNGLWRNKSLSLANELFASLTMMELEIYPNDNNKPLRGAYNASDRNIIELENGETLTQRDLNQISGCTCPVGSVAFNCPIHGGN